MRILITGGSGLIGGELVKGLVGDGHEVIVLSRRASVGGLSAGARAEEWDPETVGDWGALLPGSAVVHLAGESIADGWWTEEKKRRIRHSRVRSTEVLVEAAQRFGKPAVFLQGSAVGFYGGDRGEEELDEASAPGSDFLAEVCQAWEGASQPLEADGVRRPLLRTGVVLASDGGALPQMALPFRLFAGGPVGTGRQWMPWIHLRDEVRAIRFLLEHPTASGPFVLAAPEPVRNEDLARALGRVLRRPSFVPAPAFALRLSLAEKAILALGGQRARPQALLDLGFEFLFPSLEAALRDLLG